MQVTVRMHGELVRYMPGRVDRREFPLEPGTTLRGLLAQLGVNPDDVWMAAVNGTVIEAEDDRELRHGDRVDVFAPVAGGRQSGG